MHRDESCYLELSYLDHMLNAIYPKMFLRKMTVRDLYANYSMRCRLFPTH
jgi:hypothetical protein